MYLARYRSMYCIAEKWPDWGLNPGILDIYQVLYH